MASKRRIRRNACIGKKIFASIEEAINVSYFMRKKDELHPYKCQFCHKLHLGHKRRNIPVIYRKN